MSDFKLFNVDKKKDFLAKAKSNKNKKDQDIKKNSAIIIIQKRVRAYLTSTHYGSH